MQKIIKSSIILLIVFIIAVFFVGLNKDSTYDTKDLVGKRITKIQLDHFDDKRKITEEDLKKNDFTLINFWASWCAPCRKEHKNLIRLSKNKNLKIIGVNFKDNEDNARQFLKEMGNPFYILTEDLKGKESVNFGVYGIPETILINSKLVILKKYIGPLNFKDVNEIKKLIKK